MLSQNVHFRIKQVKAQSETLAPFKRRRLRLAAKWNSLRLVRLALMFEVLAGIVGLGIRSIRGNFLL